MERTVIILALGALLTASGCMTYRYDGKPYKSESEALAVQKQRQEQALADIQPTKNPVHGTLRIYFIDQDTAPKVLVVGNTQGAAADYVLKLTYNSARFMRDAIEKRKIFDKVELKYGSGQYHEPEPDAYVLFFYAPSTTSQSWYFVGKRVPRTPVQFDLGESDLAKRFGYFMDTLETLARADGRKT